MDPDKHSSQQAPELLYSAPPAFPPSLANVNTVRHVQQDGDKQIPKAQKFPTTTRLKKAAERKFQTGNKIPINLSTLLFSHEPIQDGKYSEKASKPVADRPNVTPRQVSPAQNDSDDSNDDMAVESENGGENLSTIDSVRRLGSHRSASVGRATIARKISAQLNSDDEIIVRMKQEKRTDKEISETLIGSGRVKYTTKSIGGRWKRLRAVMSKARDEALDLGLVSWLAEEDYALLQAVDSADRVIFKQKQAIENSKWELVTHKLRSIAPKTQFSTRSCRERFKALENGTAAIPTNLEDDPAPPKDKSEETRREHGRDSADNEATEELIEDSLDTPNTQNSTLLFSASKRNTSAITPATEEVDAESNTGKAIVSKDHQEKFKTGTKRQSIPRIDSASSESGLRPITGLSFSAQIALEADKLQHVSNPSDLKDPDKLSREELRLELRARGLCREGVKSHLVAVVKAARAGATNLKQSPIPADLSLLSTLRLSFSSARTNSDAKDSPSRRRGHDAVSSPDESPNPKRSKQTNSRDDLSPKFQYSGGQADVAATSEVTDVRQVALQEKKTLSLHELAVSNRLYEVHPTRGHVSYQEAVNSGRRLFLSNLPPDTTAEAIRSILKGHSILAIDALPTPGHFVVDCGDYTEASMITIALTLMQIQGQSITVVNAQNVAYERQETWKMSPTAIMQLNQSLEVSPAATKATQGPKDKSLDHERPELGSAQARDPSLQ